MIVDSGVYEYVEGPWRDFFRSTRAHNTVELDGENQSEVWGSFRVARRARPENVQWRQGKYFFWVQGENRGYRRLNARASHRRTFAAVGNGLWIVLDELRGHGRCTARSFIHLHPDVTIGTRHVGAFQINGAGEEVWITPFGEDRIEQSHGIMEPRCQGWYSERFGELSPNTVLSLCREAELPFSFGYVIARSSPATVHPGVSGGGLFSLLEVRGHEQIIRVSSDPAEPVSLV